MASKLAAMLSGASKSSPVDEMGEDEYSPEEDAESDKKAAFLEMAAAIKGGDFETAWEAWKDFC